MTRLAVAIVAMTASASADPRPVLSERGWPVEITGYAQVDAVFYAQDGSDEVDNTGVPLNQEHFGVPRASLRVDTHRGPFTGEVELEGYTSRTGATHPVQTSGVRLETLQLGWHHDQLVEITAGLFRVPFGTQTPTSPRDRDFLELPTVNRALFAGDLDAGVMARGQYGYARYAVAMTNGAPSGDAQWKGVDPSSSYDFIGRLGADVPLPRQLRIEAGVSALTGRTLSPATAPTKDQLIWVDENGDGLVSASELQVLAGTPAIPSQPFDHAGLGVDAKVSWCLCAVGTGYAFFEGMIGTNLDRAIVYADPILRGRDVRELGFSLGAVQHVGDHAEVGVRFDRYDADRDAHEVLGATNVGNTQRFQSLSFMAAGLWNGAKLMAQFDHARDPFGRSDSGDVISRQDDRLTLRAQVAF